MATETKTAHEYALRPRCGRPPRTWRGWRPRTARPPALAQARAPLEDYWQAVESGQRERDEEEERRLNEQLAAVGARMAFEERINAEGQLTDISAYDPIARARLAGGRQRLDERQQELRDFVGQSWDGLVDELMPEAEEARQSFWEAADALQAADRKWRRVAARYDRLDRLSARERPTDQQGREISGAVPVPMAIPWSDFELVRRQNPDAHLPVPSSNGRSPA
jgi:hypothetical protein